MNNECNNLVWWLIRIMAGLLEPKQVIKSRWWSLPFLPTTFTDRFSISHWRYTQGHCCPRPVTDLSHLSFVFSAVFLLPPFAISASQRCDESRVVLFATRTTCTQT
jgi:hypothetical protein